MTLAAAGTTYWYLTRASGVVALLLLTAAVGLGVLTSLRVAGDRWPRFAITNAHRNLTLASIVFVFLHVVTTVADGYAPIGFKDAFIPFLSPYRPIWLGLGAVSFDLLLAIVVTSLMRGVVPTRLWRGLHWLAYVSWPIALVHSLGTGSDARFGWLQALTVICVLFVAGAALARIVIGGGELLVRLAGAAAAIVVPVGLLVWYHSGPLQHGWAKRAGTPNSILASKKTTTVRVASKTISEPTSFSSGVNGTVTNGQGSNGLAQVSISVSLRGGPGGAAKILLEGIPRDEGVEMTASGVSFVPASTRTVYSGTITGLNGTEIAASVSDPAGHSLSLDFALSIDPSSGSVDGTVTST
ncbi:MAG TPA: ferric reductase-like transmembrane domain-containing protein [Gaiellaceae bacterium]